MLNLIPFMSIPTNFDMFNSTNSQTIDDLSGEAKYAVSHYTRGAFHTPGEEIIFMREVYIRKQLKHHTEDSHDIKKQGPKHKKGASSAKKELGPFHHFYHLFVFIRLPNKKIEALYFTREYKDNVVDNYCPYFLEFGVTEDDLKILTRVIKI